MEDNPDVRAYVKRHLAARYHVVEAADEVEGLAQARAAPPDLVISDVMMPNMDGFDFCRALKADAALNHIPVILLTAKASEESKLEGLETGADDYLNKPFNARELLLRAENLIEVRRLLRQRFSGEVILKPTDVAVPSADAALLERAQAYIEAHMGDHDFEVAQVADEVGVSPRQFRRKIREITGLSPAGYVRTLLLQRAAQLLEKQVGGVSEVAYEVGFQDAKYFRGFFGRSTGSCRPNMVGPADHRGRRSGQAFFSTLFVRCFSPCLC
ncbi:MAG: response regulator [Bacteroidetes bacterium]|nr:response regulator [Bacteroidota bacterium]